MENIVITWGSNYSFQIEDFIRTAVSTTCLIDSSCFVNHNESMEASSMSPIHRAGDITFLHNCLFVAQLDK